MSKENSPILVSACLLGIKCRFDGRASSNNEVIELANKTEVISVCPEQLANLPVPREPAEQSGEKVISENGEDLTPQFNVGAQMALEIALAKGCKKAILREKSPMCGVNEIYDGNFTHRKISGSGVFTKLLRDNNIPIEGKYRS